MRKCFTRREMTSHEKARKALKIKENARHAGVYIKQGMKESNIQKKQLKAAETLTFYFDAGDSREIKNKKTDARRHPLAGSDAEALQLYESHQKARKPHF